MWPLEIVGPTMKAIGHITPHAWAMDAFVALIARGADLGGIVPQLLVLLAYAAVLLPVATWRLRAALMR
jgi:ABC-2 type transport system permease protein